MSGTAPKSNPASARRFARYPLDVRISVHVFRSGESISLWGRSNELGEDGIGGTLTGEVEPGEVVSMEIVLPLAAYPLKVRAIVRYRTGLRHGFEFLAMSADQHGTIQRTCEMLSAGT